MEVSLQETRYVTVCCVNFALAIYTVSIVLVNYTVTLLIQWHIYIYTVSIVLANYTVTSLKLVFVFAAQGRSTATTGTPSRVGQNRTYAPYIWPCIWWFPCQQYRIYPVYIYGSGQPSRLSSIIIWLLLFPQESISYKHRTSLQLRAGAQQATWLAVQPAHTHTHTHTNTHTHAHTHVCPCSSEQERNRRRD